jgi:glutaconate CoA-transferase, subunit A
MDDSSGAAGVSPPGFVGARRHAERKDHALRDKRVSASEAAGLVKDGDHVAVGGCLYSRTPMALLREVLRRHPRGLTLSRSLMCYEGDLFMVAGAVESVTTSWMGIGLPWGVSRTLRHCVETGQVRFDEWSHLALGLRYRAGAMGVPFLPTLTMLGSDLLESGGARTMDCPFTGEKLCLVPALFPDVAVLHVHRADRYGNAQIDGYPHMDADLARAAKVVILSAEEIATTDELRRHGDRTSIPFFTVDAVVEARFGSFPHECFGRYHADMDAIGEYGQAVADRGTDATAEFLERWVWAPPTFGDYLALFGRERLERQERLAAELLA